MDERLVQLLKDVGAPNPRECLLRRCKQLEDAFPTTLQQDEAILSARPSADVAMVVQYRAEKKRVLQGLMESLRMNM